MSWKQSKFATSFMSVFVGSASARTSGERMQEIRQAMHGCLDRLPASPAQSQLWARVLYAPDIQSLWHLRPDVMLLLAQPLGESAARAHLSDITALFDGLLPAAQKARTARIEP